MADALGLAANIIAVVDLFVKVGVLCSVYCTDLKTAPRDIRHILNEADKFAVTLKDVDRLLAGPNGAKFEASHNLHRSIADCRLQLVDLAAKLNQGLGWKRIMWPLKKGEVTDVVKKLEQCRAIITLDLHINQTVLLLDVHQQIVLAKLRTVGRATFDSYDDADNARCHPGTRVDILRQILAWGTACDGECVFWLNGMAGTGKSTISRTVAQSFADMGMLGASFFFKRGEGDRGHTAFFFTTIAAQLVHSLPSLGPYMRDAIEADPMINEKSIRDQFDKLIAEPINKVAKHLQPPIMVIVIDALDECDDAVEHIRLIIHLLSQAKHFVSVRLRFFVTSRPELPIRLGFEDISSKYEGLVLHQIPKSVIKQDITAFLQYELAKIRQDYNKSVTPNRQLHPNWPGAEHMQKLVDMAVPLFIFAATVCRFIQDRRLGGPKGQLEKILEQRTSRRSNLDATYLPVLDQLLVNLSESEKRGVVERFKLIVGSIVILANPLSTSSLACLLAISPDTVEDQLDLLHSVLNIPPDPSIPIRLLHLSFRDFLVDPEKGKEQGGYPFWIDERETHERVAVRCLQLLSTSDTLKKDVCSLRLPGILRSEIDQQTIEAALPPEVQYACRYWVYHQKESKRRIRDGGLVNCFLTRHLLHWLEALGLLGWISESIGMVDDLLSLLDREESSNMSAFLRDTRRIILNNCSIIDIAPLQVYCSAIVFAPEQSIVRKTFRNQFPAWLSLLPQVDSEWDACLQTLEGHHGWVNSVAFSHDSKLIASASKDNTVRLWDAATGTCNTTFEGHSGDVNSVTFSHDSKLLASASSDKTVKLWDTVVGSYATTFKGHSREVNSVMFSHDSKLLISASSDKTVKLWDIATGTCTTTFEGHNYSVNSVAFSYGSKLLASASFDKTVKLWDAATGTCTATFEGHNYSVNSVAFSYDSKLLASASSDKTVKLWDTATGICTATFEGHSNSVNSVAFSYDSKLLASSSWDTTIKLWDIAKDSCTATLEGYSGSVNSVTFSHDSKLLVSGSTDRTVKLWDRTVGIHTETFESHSDNVYSVTFSHNSELLASTSFDKTIKLWDTAKGSYIATFDDNSSSVNSVTFSHDSKLLASASSDATVKLWDVATGIRIATFNGHSDNVSSVTFSHDSKLLASVSFDKTVKLWDTATGTCTATLECYSGSILPVVFSRDSKLLASALYDNMAKLWDVATGSCTATFESFSGDVSSAAFSHDSKLLILASYDETVKLWDVATRTCIMAFDVGSIVFSLAFDEASSCIHTDIGIFEPSYVSSPLPTAITTIPAAMPAPMSASGTLVPSIHCQGVGIGEGRTWITWHSHRVLWLPKTYRPRVSAVTTSTVALGCRLGRVIFVTISPKHGIFI